MNEKREYKSNRCHFWNSFNISWINNISKLC